MTNFGFYLRRQSQHFTDPFQTHRRNRSLSGAILVGVSLVVLLMLNTCWASSTGGSSVLPYENWLQIFQKSITGPVAFSVSLIGIVGCGAALILGGAQINSFLRSVIFIVLVMTLLVGSNNLMINFFNGASIGQPENTAAQEQIPYPPNLQTSPVIDLENETVIELVFAPKAPGAH